MSPERAERLLALLLYLLGGLAALAVVPVVMPTAWMESTSLWLGVDPLPRTPLTQYLTRSLSLIYALLGVLVIWLARRVRRYRDLLVFIGWLTVLLGAALAVLDFSIGMPRAWSWGEGPPTVLCGLAMVWLARRVRPL